MWNIILTGVGAGLTYGLTSFFKKEDQAFDKYKFATTLIVGVFSGVIMAFSGWDIGTSNAYLVNMGIIPVLENVMKIGYRKVYKRFF